MQIKEEVIEVLTNADIRHYIGGEDVGIDPFAKVDNPREVTQAVINAYLKSVVRALHSNGGIQEPLATVLDREDFRPYLLFKDNVFIGISNYNLDYWVNLGVTHYCDPADILPEPEGEV